MSKNPYELVHPTDQDDIYRHLLTPHPVVDDGYACPCRSIKRSLPTGVIITLPDVFERPDELVS
jgi:hypothetical protein